MKKLQLLLETKKNKTGLINQQYYALALAHTNQAEKAIPLAHQLLRDAPSDTYVKYTVAQVYALAKEWGSAIYYSQQLVDQGMSAEWFNLSAFEQLCPHTQTSEKLKDIICD
ncbi:tetratricopeptide repeat protein [Microbulbifer celer]|uniref:tetratricopeptide repeat protein n=1 Tax=Microbulbifer celer TaxID=435905 RepID=UPI001E588FED|nr:hypothetical protein [Microbulbifer celer]UFN57604.1 hypothetical protein LPW13_00740 [Microbulbifer celer]